MTWIAPRTWTDGEVPSASTLNLHVRDNLLELAPAKMIRVGDMVYAIGSKQLTRLPIGAPASTLTVRPDGTAPMWSSEPSPWFIEIWPYDGSATHTTWSTLNNKGSLFHYGQTVSCTAQNSEIKWNVFLGAGTWTLSLFLDTAVTTDVGIISIRLDGAEVSTYDQYGQSTSSYGSRVQAADIAVASSAMKLFSLKMASKNASSSGYKCGISHLAWIRTA